MPTPRILAVLCVLLPLAAVAGIESIAPKDSVSGLKTALNQGASRAVAQLGIVDGFLKNPKVKIPLPPALKKADKALRMVGMGGEADDLVVAMNRAAEAAVPEAKVLLVDAVKQMSLDDARHILTGGDDAATQYFKKVSYDKLQQRFLPVVKQKTDHAQLAKQYNELAGEAAILGLVDAKDANVESYVTRKALDGLFLVIAEEERAIRKDPLGQSSKILRSVLERWAVYDSRMHSPPYPTYSAAQVERLLDYGACIDAVREAMAGLTAEGFEQPLRNIIPLGGGRMFGLMPGVGHATLGFGAKLISVFPDPAHAGRSAHRGVVVLFHPEHGTVQCVADAGTVTEIRTGCASAVATDVLARPDARVLAIFGTGTQARSHALAVTRVRPFERLILWGRDADRAKSLQRELAATLSLSIETTQDGRKAASTADVICTVTGSTTPILQRDWVRAGTHVNVVGSSFLGPVEVDSELVRDSRYIADYRRSALAAAAEFAVAKQRGLVTDDHIVAEIGEVLLGRVTGRQSPEEITMYKSLGHIVQDLAAAACVLRRDRGEK